MNTVIRQGTSHEDHKGLCSILILKINSTIILREVRNNKIVGKKAQAGLSRANEFKRKIYFINISLKVSVLSPGNSANKV